MIFSAYMLFFLVFYSKVLLPINTEELAIDPMSLFVDPILYRFCWIQLVPLESNKIKGVEKNSKAEVTFEVFEDNQFMDKTHCIENKSRQNSYNIRLQMTTSTPDPKFFNFKISFYKPLGPPLEIIHIQAVRQRIYLEIDTDFAGISSEAAPLCDVLIMSVAQRQKKFEIIKISMPNKKYINVLLGSSFSVYYTCDLVTFFDSSTRFIKKSGNIFNDQNTKDIEPFLQLPFRRFLRAVWKHPENAEKRYDIAISKRNEDMTYTCVKIFRIFVKILPKYKIHPNTYATNCHKSTEVEDLGYFSPGGIGQISIILDMVTPLKMYKKYKFEIFWKRKSEEYISNFIHFSPLPNENSGNIDNAFFENSISNYEDLMIIPSVTQKVLSRNNINPYNLTFVKMPGYNQIDILSSVMLEHPLYFKYQETISVFDLYTNYKNFDYNKGLFPYFYALYKRRENFSTDTEIFQLPIPQESGRTIENIKFDPDNINERFTISFIISNHPNITSPAMFAIMMRFGDNEECHGVYLLKCRTCNKNYVKNTIESAGKKLKYFKDVCSTSYEREGHYDAIDSRISFTTEKMPLNKKTIIKIYSFKFNVIDEFQLSDPQMITVSFWQKYVGLITGIVSAIIILILFTGLFLFCKRLCKDPEVIEQEDSNMYERDEEI